MRFSPRASLPSWMRPSHKIAETYAKMLLNTKMQALPEPALHDPISRLAANPQAQQPANEEFTKVVGESRPPRFNDIQDSPYIRARVKEVLRTAPVPTWGIKHFADADSTYKQHSILKMIRSLGSLSAVHFDRALHPDL
ncbi:hypothetical protein BDR22DRAFT_971545 [Usnea florida]